MATGGYFIIDLKGHDFGASTGATPCKLPYSTAEYIVKVLDAPIMLCNYKVDFCDVSANFVGTHFNDDKTTLYLTDGFYLFTLGLEKTDRADVDLTITKQLVNTEE